MPLNSLDVVDSNKLEYGSFPKIRGPNVDSKYLIVKLLLEGTPTKKDPHVESGLDLLDLCRPRLTDGHHLRNLAEDCQGGPKTTET